MTAREKLDKAIDNFESELSDSIDEVKDLKSKLDRIMAACEKTPPANNNPAYEMGWMDAMTRVSIAASAG